MPTPCSEVLTSPFPLHINGSDNCPKVVHEQLASQDQQGEGGGRVRRRGGSLFRLGDLHIERLVRGDRALSLFLRAHWPPSRAPLLPAKKGQTTHFTFPGCEDARRNGRRGEAVGWRRAAVPSHRATPPVKRSAHAEGRRSAHSEVTRIFVARGGDVRDGLSRGCAKLAPSRLVRHFLSVLVIVVACRHPLDTHMVSFEGNKCDPKERELL